jgi:hypothetical protein
MAVPRRRTGIAAVIAGASFFAGQAGELVFGSPSNLVGVIFVLFVAVGLIGLAVALWDLQGCVGPSCTTRGPCRCSQRWAWSSRSASPLNPFTTSASSSSKAHGSHSASCSSAPDEATRLQTKVRPSDSEAFSNAWIEAALIGMTACVAAESGRSVRQRMRVSARLVGKTVLGC